MLNTNCCSHKHKCMHTKLLHASNAISDFTTYFRFWNEALYMFMLTCMIIMWSLLTSIKETCNQFIISCWVYCQAVCSCVSCPVLYCHCLAGSCCVCRCQAVKSCQSKCCCVRYGVCHIYRIIVCLYVWCEELYHSNSVIKFVIVHSVITSYEDDYLNKIPFF